MDSRRERFYLRNTLVGLAKCLERQYITVELRNECYVNGKITSVDGFMNIQMDDVVFQNPNNDQAKFEYFFIQARNVRYVHLPPKFDVQEELQHFNKTFGRKLKVDMRQTQRIRKTEKFHKQILDSLPDLN